MSKPPETNTTGKVYLVGAGPGDPELITLQAIERLKQAEVVLYDYLANPLLLEHAPATAETLCLGRHGSTRIWRQDEINQEMVRLAKAGKRVVRLKGGDPAIFGRFAEEAQILIENGIPFEVTPGLTAALAAGTIAGIPITHREHASAVAFVTGHEQPEKDSSSLDFEALARFPGTLVFYMGVTTAEAWVAQLLAAGMSAQTPTAIVRRCTLPDQETHFTTLSQLPELLKTVRPPVVTIIGKVAHPDVALPWRHDLPLHNQTVLITRAWTQAVELRSQLTEQGASVLIQPAIETTTPEDPTELHETLNDLKRWNWLVFSSANGVRSFLQALEDVELDIRAIGHMRIASMGTGTSRALAEYHLRPDIVPRVSRAEGMVEALADESSNARILSVRANRGRTTLADGLRDAGAEVTEIVAYESRDVTQCSKDVLAAIQNDRVDWITLTSSAIARSVITMLGEELKRMKIASISPITSETIRQGGYEPTVEATEHTMPGLIAAIVEATKASS